MGVAVGDSLAEAVEVGVIVKEGVVVIVMVGVLLDGVGIVLTFGVGVVVCPEGVAVYEGKSLDPVARTVKERTAFLIKPSLSV